MSRRHGRRRLTDATGQRPPTRPPRVRYRIVIHEISDGDERLLADYTVDGYVAAIGRRLLGTALPWRSWPSITYVAPSGCHAWRIDGAAFVQIIVVFVA